MCRVAPGVHARPVSTFLRPALLPAAANPTTVTPLAQNVELIGNEAVGGATSEGVGGAVALDERCNEESCR